MFCIFTDVRHSISISPAKVWLPSNTIGAPFLKIVFFCVNIFLTNKHIENFDIFSYRSLLKTYPRFTKARKCTLLWFIDVYMLCAIFIVFDCLSILKDFFLHHIDQNPRQQYLLLCLLLSVFFGKWNWLNDICKYDIFGSVNQSNVIPYKSLLWFVSRDFPNTINYTTSRSKHVPKLFVFMWTPEFELKISVRLVWFVYIKIISKSRHTSDHVSDQMFGRLIKIENNAQTLDPLRDQMSIWW